MLEQPSGDPTHSAPGWLSAPRSLTALPSGVRTALHQTALLGLPWYEQLAVAQNQRWQRVGVLRKTVWKYGAATLARSLRAHQLTASSLSWAGGFTGSVGFSFREAVADGRQALAEADAISAEAVVIAPGDRNGHTFRHARRLVLDGLRFLIDDAAERQLHLALLVNPPAKCVRWSHIHADDHALDLMDEIDSPWIGLASPLPRSDAQQSMLERWQRVARRACIVWTNVEQQLPVDFRTHRLVDSLKRLEKCGFTGVWELRSQATRAAASPHEQRDCCRAICEALSLPAVPRGSGVLI